MPCSTSLSFASLGPSPYPLFFPDAPGGTAWGGGHGGCGCRCRCRLDLLLLDDGDPLGVEHGAAHLLPPRRRPSLHQAVDGLLKAAHVPPRSRLARPCGAPPGAFGNGREPPMPLMPPPLPEDPRVLCLEERRKKGVHGVRAGVFQLQGLQPQPVVRLLLVLQGEVHVAGQDKVPDKVRGPEGDAQLGVEEEGPWAEEGRLLHPEEDLGHADLVHHLDAHQGDPVEGLGGRLCQGRCLRLRPCLALQHLPYVGVKDDLCGPPVGRPDSLRRLSFPAPR